MTALTSLPPELLHELFSYSDLATCKALRLTCLSFSKIGSHWVFREALLTTKLGSSAKLENILADPELARCVSRFHFDLMSWSSKYRLKNGDHDEDYEHLGKDIDFFPKGVDGFLKRLSEFPNLRDVTISFHPKCVSGNQVWDDAPQMPEFRLAIMQKFLQSVAALPQLPRELAIRNQQNINLTDPEVVANLQKVLGAVRSLRLNITNQHSVRNGEIDLFHPEVHRFCDQLPSFWLKPTLSNLQHLTLYSSMYFGFYPKLDLSGIHFPHLKSLALGNFTFVHDSQLEWILSHGSTLTELYLDDCPILFEVAIDRPEKSLLDPAVFGTHDGLFDDTPFATYEKRWHHYFRAFQERLPHLRVFRFGHAQSWWANNSTPFEAETTIEPHFGDESYLVFCDGYGPSPYMEATLYDWAEDGERHPPRGDQLHPSEEDKTALIELCAKIGQKTRSKLVNWEW